MSEIKKKNLRTDLDRMAELIGVELDPERTDRVLDVFSAGFQNLPVEMRTTNKPSGSQGLSYRFVDFEGRYPDPMQTAVDGGLVKAEGRVWQFAKEAAQGELMGWGVDASATTGVEKIWPFLGKSRRLEDVEEHMPSLPSAVCAARPALLAHGMSRYSIVAADFAHETCNLYFPLQDRSWATEDNFRSLADALGLHVDEDLLPYMTQGLFANFTFSWTRDEVQRFCVYVPAPSPDAVPPMREPITTVLKSAPFAFEARAFIMGPTLTRDGSFVKIETDWSGMIMGIFQQCMGVEPAL